MSSWWSEFSGVSAPWSPVSCFQRHWQLNSRVKTVWIWLSFSTLSKECPHETWSAKLAKHECPSDSHCFHSAVPQLVIILEADNLQETLSSTNFVFITFSLLENLSCSLPVTSVLAVILPLLSAIIRRSKAEPSSFVSWCSSPLIRIQTLFWPGTSSCLPLSPTPLRAGAPAGAHENWMG